MEKSFETEILKLVLRILLLI